jgi:cysteine synthase A
MINVESLVALVGETPLLRLKSISDAVGGTPVFGKCEWMSPGQSIKDRPVAQMLADANLPPHSLIVEATAGNTGSALCQFANALGHRVLLTVPDKIAPSKIAQLRALGAEVVLCDTMLPGTDSGHFINTAVRLAAERGGWFANQFENASNRLAHLRTGAEIVRQVGGSADGLVVALATGTGGSAAGIGAHLASVNGGEPALCLIATRGQSIVFDNESKQFVARSPDVTALESTPPSTLSLEGVGPGKFYANLVAAAPFVKRSVLGGPLGDLTAAAMCRFLVRREGVFVGGSAAFNVCAAVLAARLLRPRVVVTLLCDGGERYLSKQYDDDAVVAAARACGISDEELPRFLKPDSLAFMNAMLELNGAAPFLD